MSESSREAQHAAAPDQPAADRQPEALESVVLAAMPPLGRLYALAARRSAVRAGTGLLASGPGRLLAHRPRPGVGGSEDRARRRGGTGPRVEPAPELPRVQIVVPEVTVEPGAHAEFCRVVGAPLRSRPDGSVEAFSGYLHALAFPAAMALLTRRDFPLPVVGLVHLANSVHHVRPVAVGQRLGVTVRAQRLRAHRAGTAFDVVTELRAQDGGAPVWTGSSTYLARGVRLPQVSAQASSRASSHASPQAPVQASSGADGASHPVFVAPEPTGRWSLPGDTGRRYARVSGDVNPIHLSAVSARALGLEAAIAHGMFTASRALAALEAPAPLDWDVEFAAPLVLPGRPAVAVRRDGRGDGFVAGEVTVWDRRRARPHAVVTARRPPQPPPAPPAQPVPSAGRA